MLALFAASLLAGAGCDGEKGGPVRVMSHDEARTLVETYATALMTDLGAPVRLDPARVNPSPCEGRAGEPAPDRRYYMQGNYQVPGEPGQLMAGLTRLRDQWQLKRYEIKGFRTFTGPDEGELVARNPDDGVQISVQTTRPPTAYAVIIVTPCVQPPA